MTKANIKIRFFESPGFSDLGDVSQFDQLVFENNPGMRYFMRRSFRGELSPGKYDDARRAGIAMFSLVVAVVPGINVSNIYAASPDESPAAVCVKFEQDAVIQDLIQTLPPDYLYENN
jgi:hypothetical protein